MKAKLKDYIVDVWKISNEEVKDAWVKEAFDANKIYWNDEKGRVSTLQKLVDKDESYKTTPNNLSRTTLIVRAPFIDNFGLIGDYLVYDTHRDPSYRVLSQHTFDRECQVIEQ